MPRITMMLMFVLTLGACGGGGSEGVAEAAGGLTSGGQGSSAGSGSGTSAGTGTGTGGPPASGLEIGANLPPINDWSQTPVFVDLVRQARPWGTPSAPWDEAGPRGADGWPSGDFGAFLSTAQSGVSGNAGTYKVSMKGKAVVGLKATVATIARQSYDPATDRTTADVVMPPGGEQLVLTFTKTDGGVKDLQVIRPGYDAEHPPLFTRPFLDHIARFKVLRFMDWVRTNVNNEVTRWDARPTPHNPPFATARGVPWEFIVALANESGKDIWIDIPIRADDNYVRELARLLRSTLRPDLRIYVEYSNEVWNGGFGQYNINKELARAEVAANPQSPLVYDGATDLNLLGMRRVAHRLKQIGDIFRTEFGAAAADRVRPVLAGQVVRPFILQTGLEFIAAVYGPPAQYFHALAGAPYFNMGSKQTTDGLTVDDVLTAWEGSITVMRKAAALDQNRALATRYGLRWFAYEGGADTFGPGSIAAKAAASMDPRLEAICLRYLKTWQDAGGELFMWFMAGAGRWDHKYGTWELTPDLAVTDAPKLRCVDRALAGDWGPVN